MMAKQKEWYKRWWAITLFVIVGLIFIGSLLPDSNNNSRTNTNIPSAQESNKVVLTQELKDEICYEMDTYVEYCYGQGNPLDQCASETLEKVKRIYGITDQQFLEVNDYCYSNG